MTVAELMSQLSSFPPDAIVAGEEDAYGSLREIRHSELVRVKARGDVWAPTGADDTSGRLAVWLRPE